MLRFALLLFCACVVLARRCEDVTTNDLEADIVVVGSGAGGGAALYEILKNHPSDGVLVLESGTLDLSELTTKLKFNRIQLGQFPDIYSHQGVSRPIDGFGGRTQMWPQTANRVGGSSTWYNGNEVVASAALQTRFYNMLDNEPTYSPANFMRKVKELERYDSGASPADPRRGTTGPLAVTRVPINGPRPLAKLFCDGILNVTGIGRTGDYGLDAYGCSETWNLYATRDGKRSGAQTAFFNEQVFTDFTPPVLSGPRVTLLTGAHVTRYLTTTINTHSARGNNGNNGNGNGNGNNGNSGNGNSGTGNGNNDNNATPNKVTGVAFTLNGIPGIARARKAYYNAAGLLSAPLLQVSGIGPCADLTAAGITCVADLPVGRQLYNHIAAGFTFTSPANWTATDPDNANFTNTMGAFLPDPRYPIDGIRGVQIIFQDGLFPGSAANANPAVKALTFFMLRAESSGNTTVRTGSVYDNPIVYYNYADPSTNDTKFFVSLIRNTLVPFARYLESFGFVFTAPGYATCADDALLNTWLANNLRQTHHAQGTVPIAPRNKGGVVNPKTGAVYTFSNLFSCDTSSTPLADGNMFINVASYCGLHAENAVRRNWKA